MKKKFLTAITVLTMAVSMCACTASAEVDVTALADSLNETITSDTLGELNEKMLATTYFVEDSQITAAKVYVSSAATACEVAVFQCTDEDTAKAVETLMEKRVENQSALYASYNADEAARLEDALIEQSDVYVVFYVGDDNAAAEALIKEAGF